MFIGLQSHTVYNIDTPLYTGPLDLLLQLIEKAELDITKLSLSQVTDQYLSYFHNLPSNATPEEVSAFLVIASRLLQIKSEMLLPRLPELHPEEIDDGELLARQLIVYRRFKEAAHLLDELEKSNLRTYLRLSAHPKIEGKIELEDLSLSELLDTALAVFMKDKPGSLSSIVAPYRVTIREKIDLINNSLDQNEQSSFRRLLSSKPHRLDVVITFLAILELVKRRLIRTYQEKLFEDIVIDRSENWESQDKNFELEFGE